MVYTPPLPLAPRAPVSTGHPAQGPTTGPWAPPPKPVPNAADGSAKAIIEGFLDQYGLSSLASWAWGQYLALGGGPDAITQIQFELPKTDAFQKRFPAYNALAKSGHAMTPGDMIALENSYAAALHGAGLPAGFYDHPNDFAQFMIQNVSPSEVAQRAQLAATAVLQDDPSVLAELKMMGVPAGHQIAWILDPGRALPLVQNTVLAAQDAAAGLTTGYGQITRAEALSLAQQGVTADTARTTFSQLGQESGLFQGTTEEGTDISQGEQIGAAFQGNVFAQKRIQSRADQRVADFKGGSGFNPTSKGVTGLGEQT